MLDAILEIPGNRPVFEDLQRLLAERKAVAFVGAGASAGMYPLWGQLIRQLCEHAVASGFASEADRKFWLSIADSKPAQVVRGLRQKLTGPQLSNMLRTIFGPQPGTQRYTATHEALMKIPFSGYVTTNYDAGLLEARLALRPAVTAVGWSTWRDGDELEFWRDPARMASPFWCPVLFAHGFYQRSDTIVLGIEEYRRAYGQGPWRRLFEHLWSSSSLVFVGFGFSDPFLDFITGEVVSQSTDQTAAIGRHIAFVGLGEGDSYTEERRRFFLQNYDVRPLFYPAPGHDHSALQSLLEALASRDLSQSLSLSAPIPPSTAIPSRWVHETTNDQRFRGRQDEITRLGRWVADPAVCAVGICAVGGTGKTALVGHWLKNTDEWRSRSFSGLFAWSFYQERDSSVFLRAFVSWAHQTLDITRQTEQHGLVTEAISLLRKNPLIVVLDGLEVLQEGPEQARYGTFLDIELRELLVNFCARQQKGLAVLTSRFTFSDLERFLGTSFHQLELPGLLAEEGAALLDDLNVRGSDEERQYVSRLLEGHPLGLRVFADAIPENQCHQPREFLDTTFRTAKLSNNSPLTGKLQRLLAFYERNLPVHQAAILSIVALFRSPVPEESVARLAQASFSLPTSVATTILSKLHSRGVLTREPAYEDYGYSCHPILRDHFREVFIGTGAVKTAADLLKGRPSQRRPRSTSEIEPLLIAIEILIDANDILSANDIFRQRLDDGEIFKLIPAPHEGLRCTLKFLQNEKFCTSILGRVRTTFYKAWAGLCASLCGYYELATRLYSEHNKSCIALQMQEDASRGLLNQGELSIFLGDLAEAAQQTSEALQIADRLHVSKGMMARLQVHKEMMDAYIYRGWTNSLSGDVWSAAEDFARADALEKAIPHSLRQLNLRRAQWAEFLLRTGHPGLARSYASDNLERVAGWPYGKADCNLVLINCSLAEGWLDLAEEVLNKVKPAMHESQMLFDIARLLVTAGNLALARRNVITALQESAAALALARPRGMKLIQADALVLRGRARALETTISETSNKLNLPLIHRALDDADDALRLSRECNYAWGERDALKLKSNLYSIAWSHSAEANDLAIRFRAFAHRNLDEAYILAKRLALTETELKEVEVRAKDWIMGRSD